jgi:hypothetical protein
MSFSLLCSNDKEASAEGTLWFLPGTYTVKHMCLDFTLLDMFRLCVSI